MKKTPNGGPEKTKISREEEGLDRKIREKGGEDEWIVEEQAKGVS